MVWVPDHMWAKQKGKGKGWGGGGGNAAALVSVIQALVGGGKDKGGKGSGKLHWKEEEARQATEKLSKMDDSCKVYVGDLPKGLEWKDLKDHLKETIGITPKIVHIPHGKRHGVAAFTDALEAALAIEAANGSTLKGLNITLSTYTQPAGSLGEAQTKKQKTGGLQNREPPESRKKITKTEDSVKVYVGDLPKGVQEKDLEDHFTMTTGMTPTIVHIPPGKRHGFAAFKDAAEAAAAIGLANGSMLKNLNITVGTYGKK